MSGAGKYHLKWSLARDRNKPADVGEQQVRPLVCSHSAREADQGDIIAHLNGRLALDQRQEFSLGFLMGIPHQIVRKLIGPGEDFRLKGPMG